MIASTSRKTPVSCNRFLSEQIAQFALADFSQPSGIPEQVREHAAQRILDNMGCMFFGWSVPPACISANLAMRLGRGECRVVGNKARTSAPAAALVQGIMAQSFEMNDLGAYVHAGACVVPAALAALEEGGSTVTGAQFLAAVVAGYEVTVRLAESIGSGAELDVGWHTPGFHGTVGAAVTAALILGLDASTIAQSISIAADLAGGGLMVARLGSDTKRLHCGRGAETGVLSALMAREGVLCRIDALENEQWGYCRAMAGGQPAADLGAMTRLLGEKYVGFDRTSIKYYCVGAEVLGAIDNINKIKRRPGFAVEAIESITVGTPKFFVLAEAHQFPRSATEVHFNIEYGVAMALNLDVAPIHEAGEELLNRWMVGFQDPKVLELWLKVRHVTDEELDKRNPYSVDSRVQVRMRNGSVFAEETDYVKNAESKATMKFAPMDVDKIVKKFGVLSGRALTPQRRDAFVADILGLERLPLAKQLWRQL